MSGIYSLFDVKYILAVVCLGQFSTFVFSTFFLPKKPVQDEVTKSEEIEEIVDLQVFRGSGVTISSSPYSSKIITYCRMAGIPHSVNVADFTKAPKSKVPYIIHGKNKVGDSNLIIRYLENTYNISAMANDIASNYGLKKPFVPYSKLSVKDQALSDLIRAVCENNLYWATGGIRFLGCLGIGKSESLWPSTVKSYFLDFPGFIRPIITSMIRVSFFKDAWSQGLARHSAADQMYLVLKDVRALSTMVGDNLFVLGDFPSEIDCMVLGTVENLLDDSNWPNDLTNAVRNYFPNLVKYKERVKGTFFSDMKVGDLLPVGKPYGKPIKNC